MGHVGPRQERAATEGARETDLTRLFPGDSQMARLMRSHDWSATNLGPPGEWPATLRTAVSICLMSRFPILIWWGPELTVLYNDPYIPFLGEAKHPRQLGRPGRECWAEIWDVIGSMLEGVRATGEATWSDDVLLFFARKLPREEVYVRFTYGPILGADGRSVEGVFTPCTENTEQVVGARRLETLRKLGLSPAEARTVESACREAAVVLGENPYDAPFAAIYRADDAGVRAALVASAGLPGTGHPLPATVEAGDADDSLWRLATVLRTREGGEVDLATVPATLPGGPWPEPCGRALVLPIPTAPGGPLAAILVVGVSPRRVLDAAYRQFFDFAARHIGTAIADARAHEEERRRAEALAELDRAKTAFFSDVSHEFRTPLTLILGPIDQILAKPEGGVLPENRELLTVARRNANRLRKLVNALLDFARIEAGRMRANYEPTDLATFTAELAGVFRSAVESAGLRFLVACEPLGEPAYVDRAMWEKWYSTSSPMP